MPSCYSLVPHSLQNERTVTHYITASIPYSNCVATIIITSFFISHVCSSYICCMYYVITWSLYLFSPMTNLIHLILTVFGGGVCTVFSVFVFKCCAHVVGKTLSLLHLLSSCACLLLVLWCVFLCCSVELSGPPWIITYLSESQFTANSQHP